jgi:Zn ribbon nucleic-acid-binding protein
LATTTAADCAGAACGHCGARLHAGTWRELELVDAVTPGQVIVTRWPREKGIEVRRCLCGHAVARIVAVAHSR